MKISQEHFDYLRAAIEPWDTLARRFAYRRAGYSADRYRWDMLWASGLGPWVSANLYPAGLADSHIDSALRKIVRDNVAPADKESES